MPSNNPTPADKEERSQLFFAQVVEVDAGGEKGAHRDAGAKTGHERCRGYRQPARGERAIHLQPRHEAAAVDHEHAEANQHRRQAETEGNDQEEAQTDAVQGEGAEQDHQRRGAWDDAAGNAQGKELVERNGFARRRWFGCAASFLREENQWL
jgi:hypothetical protein